MSLFAGKGLIDADGGIDITSVSVFQNSEGKVRILTEDAHPIKTGAAGADGRHHRKIS